MATIQNLKLNLIEHDHKRKIAKVKVSYKLRLSSVERSMPGLRFREQIQLWGADTPDPDDYLYAFSTATFSSEPDGIVDRARTEVLGDEILDEDGWPRPTDEVYAKVWVNPIMPVGDYERSNEIHHKF